MKIHNSLQDKYGADMQKKMSPKIKNYQMRYMLNGIIEIENVDFHSFVLFYFVTVRVLNSQ